MRDHARLSEMGREEIESLRADGFALTDEDIVELSSLGWGVEYPEGRRLLARGVPVEVAGVHLWPMTIYGNEWYNRVGCHMAGKSAVYALAYAMAHSRNQGEPLAMDGREAEKVVTRWGRDLRCTFGELNVAIEQVLRQDEEAELPPSDDSKPVAPGDLSAFLAAACGGDPDFWERRCASDYAYSVLEAIVKQNKADGKPSASDPSIKAIRALGWAVEKIRKRGKES